MKRLEEFRIPGYGDMSDPKTAHKKLLGNIKEIYDALKKENYSYILARFDKRSVEYAFAFELDKLQKEAQAEATKDDGKW